MSVRLLLPVGSEHGGNIRPSMMLFSSHHHLEILVARSGHQNVTFLKVWVTLEVWCPTSISSGTGPPLVSRSGKAQGAARSRTRSRTRSAHERVSRTDVDTIMTMQYRDAVLQGAPPRQRQPQTDLASPPNGKAKHSTGAHDSDPTDTGYLTMTVPLKSM